MNNTDPRVDLYIEKSPAYAQAILSRLRQLIHELCPEVCEEIKWGAPHFMYRSAALCGIAAFKNHCVLHFSKASLMNIAKDSAVNNSAMGQFGKISTLAEVPGKKTLLPWINEAMLLNEQGVKRIIKKLDPRQVDAMIHPDFLKALKSSKKIHIAFFALSPSHRKEYIEYINEAKRPETRERRIENSISKLKEGLSHNFKYNRKIIKTK